MTFEAALVRDKTLAFSFSRRDALLVDEDADPGSGVLVQESGSGSSVQEPESGSGFLVQEFRCWGLGLLGVQVLLEFRVAAIQQ